tara:strand:+ start:357 stop:1604 length:1248 start_codon:yes stop_codon:yes gene_type:complete
MNKYNLLKIFKYILFIIPLLFIYLIRPFKIIRFLRLPSEFIGGLAEHIESYQCKKIHYNEKNKYLDLFCYGKIANVQLAKMVKEKLIILPKNILEPIIILNRFFSNFIKILKVHEINIKSYRDINNLYSKYSPNIEFNESELKLGKSTLLEMGISENSKYICFDIRDETYKKKSSLINKDMSYHDYRNFNSDNFIEAAEKIAEKGYYVLRMGKYVNKKFISNNKRIIDYANSKFRSDFMDIYLGAHCEFCVTTGAGFSTIPLIFNKPLAAIIVPLGLIQTYSNRFISITKHHYFNGKKLKAKEIFEKGIAFLLRSNFFKEKKVTLEEPSSEEISKFALEAFDRFVEKKNFSNENEELQVKFRSKFKEYLDIAELNDPKYQDNLKLDQYLQPEKIKGFFGTDFLIRNNFFNEDKLK